MISALTPGALVLEGGGMRGAFSAGVTDYFLDEGLLFDHIYGVSIGACHACSYISQQRGRAYRIVADYINDPRYMSYKKLAFGGNLFSPEFIYHTIPDELDPFDYDAFREYKGDFCVVMTDCKTGAAKYARVSDLKTEVDYVRASASLPGLSRIVKVGGGDYLDGGMADSIPVKRAAADGCKKTVAVLTREEGYVKEPSKAYRMTMLLHPLHPKLSEAVKTRHIMYNETLDYIDEKEAAGEIFVLRPPKGSLHVGRLERDRAKLDDLYRVGYETAKAKGAELKKYLAAENAKEGILL